MRTIKANFKTCEPILGFNTKQWWVYDNENNIYIDPPKDVLDKLSILPEEQREKALANIIATNPEWLQDSNYWYDDEDFEI